MLGRAVGKIGKIISSAHLVSDQRGQAAVEFVMMISLALLVMFAFMSICMVGVDALILRYASFVGARAYLVRDSDWKKQAATVVKITPGATDSYKVESVDGKGVRVTAEVQELFPLMGLLSDSGKLTLAPQSPLGREPKFRGDNQPGAN